MITGTTLLAGVIGWPVKHSRSPAIHNAAAKAVGADLVYTAFPVAPGAAGAAVDAVRTLGLRGVSVTMPHKEAVIPYLDELTPGARSLGAVNHITNTDGYLIGNNTDGAGFLVGLHHHGIDVASRTVAVIGSGGAARAIVHSCANAGANVIVIARNADAAATAAQVGGDNARVGAPRDVAQAAIAVNATPVGMATDTSPNPKDVPVDVDVLSDDAVVVDIVYNPLETELLRQARMRGLTGIDGLAMLAGQAAVQFETWTGSPAPIDLLMAAARA